jgi:hypothetical protein
VSTQAGGQRDVHTAGDALPGELHPHTRTAVLGQADGHATIARILPLGGGRPMVGSLMSCCHASMGRACV